MIKFGTVAIDGRIAGPRGQVSAVQTRAAPIISIARPKIDGAVAALSAELANARLFAALSLAALPALLPGLPALSALLSVLRLLLTAALRSGLLDDAAMARIAATARVTARLYALQLEELDNV